MQNSQDNIQNKIEDEKVEDQKSNNNELKTEDNKLENSNDNIIPNDINNSTIIDTSSNRNSNSNIFDIDSSPLYNDDNIDQFKIDDYVNSKRVSSVDNTKPSTASARKTGASNHSSAPKARKTGTTSNRSSAPILNDNEGANRAHINDINYDAKSRLMPYKSSNENSKRGFEMINIHTNNNVRQQREINDIMRQERLQENQLNLTPERFEAMTKDVIHKFKCKTVDDLTPEQVQILKDARVYDEQNPKQTTLKVLTNTAEQNPKVLEIRKILLGDYLPTVEEYRTAIMDFINLSFIKRNLEAKNPNNILTEDLALITLSTVLMSKGISQQRLEKYSKMIVRNENNDSYHIDIDNPQEIAYDSTVAFNVQASTLRTDLSNKYQLKDHMDLESYDAMQRIFNAKSLNTLSPNQMKILNVYFKDKHTAEEKEFLKNVSLQEALEIKSYIEGDSLNQENMTSSIKYLKNLINASNEYITKQPRDPYNDDLKAAIANCRNTLTSKKLTNDEIDYLVSSYGKESFQKDCDDILFKLYQKNLAKIPHQDVIDKAYSDLAEAFDAKTFKSGAELDEYNLLKAANIFKTLNDYAEAIKPAQDIKDNIPYIKVTRHMAKIQRFLEIKGITKGEIEQMKVQSLDTKRFNTLVEEHWNVILEQDNNAKSVQNNVVNNIQNNNSNNAPNELPKEIKIDITFNNGEFRKQITIPLNTTTAEIALEPFELGNNPNLVKNNTVENNITNDITTENNTITNDDGMVESETNIVNTNYPAQ